jgi:hypothetical protein
MQAVPASTDAGQQTLVKVCGMLQVALGTFTTQHTQLRQPYGLQPL